MIPYALTIFLSAFLLFQVQPLMGKYLLPWFGGAPAVWTTCMLFFQVLLLGGYAYAHWTVSHLDPRVQRRVQVGLLFASTALAVLLLFVWKSPILPPAAWKPNGAASPTTHILGLLGAGVGLPYFLLSTTSPVLQTWFRRLRPGASPYRLYALSNLGSLLALLSYPFVVEPALALKAQALVWEVGYAGFTILCAWCLYVTSAVDPAPPASGARAERLASAERADAGASGSRHPYWLWVSLAACASMLLLAITSQMCEDVAAIPFLWILPLALYLVSLIICFDRARWYARAIFGPLLALGVGGASIVLYRGVDIGIVTQVTVYCLALFACCMVCHGELVRLKPDPRHLTAFYLMVSTGGALGGVAVGLIAPHLFRGFWEVHGSLWLTCLLAVLVWVRDPRSWLREGRLWPALLVLVGADALAIHLLGGGLPNLVGGGLRAVPPLWLTGPVALAILAALGVTVPWLRTRFSTRGRAALAGAYLGVSLAFLGAVLASDATAALEGAVEVSRNFYGVLTVEDWDPGDPGMERYALRHGRIDHGYQFRADEKRRLPTSYYSEDSGIGLALRHRPRTVVAGPPRSPLRIGIVGLGVGTTAAYARAGDYVRFYEINPDVIRLSFGPRSYFSYLRDCPAKVDVVLGDARLSMERELERGAPQAFDVLAVDAFSSDAIPVHLLTREAIQLYLRHLRARGSILAVHISNHYLDLSSELWALADSLGLASALIETEDAEEEGKSGSTWMLLSRDPHVLRVSDVAEAATPRDPAAGRVRVWTDDYSNLFQALKRWR